MVLPVTLRITSLSSTIFGFGHSTDGDQDQLCLAVRGGALRVLTHLDAVLALPGQGFHVLGGVAILLAVARGVDDILFCDSIVAVADGLLSLGCDLGQHVKKGSIDSGWVSGDDFSLVANLSNHVDVERI